MELERQVIEVIAADRLHIPVSSMDGKLKRRKEKLAKAVDLSEHAYEFAGDRVYARVEAGDTMKARGMKEAIDVFAEAYPRHGQILRGLIEEERAVREVNMYFGVNSGCKLTADDYLGVMQSLGFSEAGARVLYPELMNVSRNLSRKRAEERSILVG